jgi:hypothetical protein
MDKGDPKVLANAFNPFGAARFSALGLIDRALGARARASNPTTEARPFAPGDRSG